MISRRTARILSELMADTFKRAWGLGNRAQGYHPDGDAAYDFLYDNAYAAWFCNAAKDVAKVSTSHTRYFKEFFMKVHTGESLAAATQTWSWQQRERLGQQLLEELCEDIVYYWQNPSVSYALNTARKKQIVDLRASLELDGYEWRDDKLLPSEQDVLDVKEEAGALEQLYGDLQLADRETAMHHLRLSEEHYLAQRWDDSIGNSRKFLELVLLEVARLHSATAGVALTDEALSRPVRVRDYLERSGLLESKEKEAIASVYGLLSETGSHPYMAQNDQARLLRHLALTFSQFVMLRFRGLKAA